MMSTSGTNSSTRLMGRQRKELRPTAKKTTSTPTTTVGQPKTNPKPITASIGRPLERRMLTPPTPPATTAASQSTEDSGAFMEESLSDSDDDIDAKLAAIDGKTPPRMRGKPSTMEDEDEDEDPGEYAAALTEEKLKELTGFEDLHLVTGTELKVDATNSCISIIGDLMPQLLTLRFSGSRIPTLRDLGTKLVQLQVLWANNCCVQSLSGVQFSHQLRELYVPFNSITDISFLNSLLNLEVIDMEGNAIDDATQLNYLTSLEDLRELSLSGNPFAVNLGSVTKYRNFVKETLSSHCSRLELLDDVPVSTNSSGEEAPKQKQFVDPLSDLAAELDVVNASIKVHQNVGMEALVEEQHRNLYSRQSTSVAGARRRPPSTVGKSVSGSSVPEALREVSSAPVVPVTESPKKTRLTHSSEGTPTPTKLAASPGGAASKLTQGSGVFSGNLTKNLRARRVGSSSALPTGKKTAALEPTSSLTVEEERPSTSQRASTPTSDNDALEVEDDECLADDEQPVRRRRNTTTADDLLNKSNDSEDDDADDVETARRELLDAKQPELEFMDKYKELIEETAAQNKEEAELKRHMSKNEIIAAVGDYKRANAKLLQEEILTETAGAGTAYESLQMGDLGDDIDGVL